MWTIFSLVATIAQHALDKVALLAPMMVSTSAVFGAALLIAAGAYQLTPFKNACLRNCRAPAHFLSRYWRTGNLGAFRMGTEARRLLRGLPLDPDGTAVRRRRDEPPVDSRDRYLRPAGEDDSIR
jgi:hypothetical protein